MRLVLDIEANGLNEVSIDGNKIVIWEGSSEPLKGQFLICKDGKYYLI